MPDEAFEALWELKGGADLVALHRIFSGATLPGEEVRAVLGLSVEQFRTVAAAAARVGLVEQANSALMFIAYAADSAQYGRLEWCLESHKEEFPPVVARLKSDLLLRFLSTPPGRSG